ncbi:PES4 (YFR023W) and MIP6 (YHR015W) [Zygosaccharomyces parabailii]|nr:PES4 (YFR023W) and MIP6 (YHR015W) [Zygosaccharomyces parabailii]CDH12287.1 related to Protein PES4 [Zygosaccharomyces bailii ISA1307]
MFNPFGLKKINVLENISLNVPKSSELSSKNTLKTDKPGSEIQAGELSVCSNENKSVSSTSSQSDFSDVVKLNGPCTHETQMTKKNKNAPSSLESKSCIALFIGDLDKRVTEETLANLFGKYESLVSVKVCKDTETGKSLGYGYLNFRQKMDTLAAIDEFNYRPILDREVRIMPSLRNTFYRKNMGTNVFFSNLPLENPDLTTRVFYDTFKIYGNILSCKLDKRKNIGFVYFDSDYAARVVIKEFNGKEFFGTKVLCGIHFDKELRKFPEFEKRKASLNEITTPKEELTAGPSDKSVVEHNSGSQIPHPNAIFVKNLPPTCNDVEILEFFSKIGPVKSVFSSAAPKYHSLWAFVTYKKGSDTEKAIDFYQGANFKERELTISKAEPKNKNVPPKERNSGHYRCTIFLQNLSSICNEQFLTQMCIQERIKIVGLEITTFYEESLTYAGYVKCRSKNDAHKMFELLNNRLIGGCVVKVTWGKPETFIGAISLAQLARYNNRQVQLQRGSRIQSEALMQAHAHSQPQARNPAGQLSQPSLSTSIHPHPPVFPLPIYSPFYYPAQAMGLAPQGAQANSISTNQITPHSQVQNHFPVQRKDQQMQILEYLKRQVKKGIDFLRYPTASREENLVCISEYIFEVYWQRDLNAITNFLLLLNSSTQNESILNKQIDETAKYLGFGR